MFCKAPVDDTLDLLAHLFTAHKETISGYALGEVKFAARVEGKGEGAVRSPETATDPEESEENE